MELTNRLCINNFTYRRYTFGYFLQSAKKLGIKRIELSGCHPHFTEYEAENFDVHALADDIADAGLEVAVIAPEQNFLPINIATDHEYLWAKSIETLEFYIRSSRAFGCDKVLLYPGKGAMDQDFNQARKNSVKAIKKLCQTAREEGVELILQNVSACISNMTTTLEDFKALYDMVDEDNLFVSVNTCPLDAVGESLDMYFQTFGEKIHHIQLADSEDGDEQLAIGEGNQDFKAHLEIINRYGYEGAIALEVIEEEYAYEAEDAYEDSIVNIIKIAEEVE